MNWNKLLSTKRLGTDGTTATSQEDRSQFQRDYDRIIFSSPFRRMQNKTQVFPLPDHIFVHNRLTHSLEVASVGRSLGSLLSERLLERKWDDGSPYVSEIGTIVSAACLAHDLGNPPFGHSGEAAIANYFKRGKGTEYRGQMSAAQWNDFLYFDGNANAFRLLTHQFKGKRPGGFALTYSTLAGIVKYPYESGKTTKQKFGFFQSNKEDYYQIAETLEIPRKADGSYARHPLVYLVEAADDICYQIMDLEDAFKLGIIDYDEVCNLFLGFYHPVNDRNKLQRIDQILRQVADRNEQVNYLRSGVIGNLIYACVEVFLENYEAVMKGHFEGSLVDHLPETAANAMERVKEVSMGKIYAHRSVVEIEIAGYKIIGTLLDEFVRAVIHPKDSYSQKLLSLLPAQYAVTGNSAYEKIQAVVDFVSGMTDVFALDLYRKITGISLPGVD